MAHALRLMLGAIVACTAATSAYADKLWWSDWGTGKIERSNLDGSFRETVLAGLQSSGAIWFTIDPDSGYLYMAESSARRISRAMTNGTGLEVLVSSGLQYPAGIVLDATRSKMYWVDRIAGKIQRANLDGTAVEDILTDLVGPKELAIDALGAKLYWLEQSSAPALRRCNLDGTETQILTTVGLAHPSGLALDFVEAEIYWLDFDLGTVHRADFDGLNAELFLDRLQSPSGLALDERRRLLYVSSQLADTVARTSLDSPLIENVVTDGLVIPFRLLLSRGMYDLYDFQTFQACFGHEAVSNYCRGYDNDDDNDVDFADFSTYMNAFTGP